MSMIQIVTVAGEVNASIIKGLLENAGIKAGFGMGNNVHSNGVGSSAMSQSVFVGGEKAEEAVVLLKERGLVK